MKKYLSLFILNYLRFFAKLQLLKNRSATIVGITGSAGKSSTLYICEAALKDHFCVKTNSGYNSESGIPFSILGIKVSSYSPMDWLKYTLLAPIKLIANWEKYDIFLVEMGVDKPNDMSFLLSVVRPTIGIFLNVGLVHGHNFPTDSLQNIGLEKAKLINSLPTTGYALLNINDPIVSQTTQICLAKKIVLKPIHLELEGYAPPKSFDISISAAFNLAKIFKISQNDATASIQKNLILPPSRSSLFKGVNNSTIIDSSYNSSPLSCKEMLDVLSKYPSPRIAILGDMRELGSQTKTTHEEIYRQALKSANTIISVGPETKKYFGDKAVKFNNFLEVNEYLQKNLPSKATILIKGSQNTIFLEEVTKALMLQSSHNPICRQSPYWLKVKSTSGLFIQRI